MFDPQAVPVATADSTRLRLLICGSSDGDDTLLIRHLLGSSNAGGSERQEPCIFGDTIWSASRRGAPPPLSMAAMTHLGWSLPRQAPNWRCCWSTRGAGCRSGYGDSR